MRPEKSVVALTSAIARLDPEPLNKCLDNQPHPPSPPPHFPPVAKPNPTPRRAATFQRPVSLVVRNTRKSRNKPFYTSVSRSNHYLLAKSLVENDQPPSGPLVSERKSRAACKTAPSQFCVLPPDSTVSDFIWRFSAPDQDPQIYDAFAMLKAYDPQTFSELIAGFD